MIPIRTLLLTALLATSPVLAQSVTLDNGTLSVTSGVVDLVGLEGAAMVEVRGSSVRFAVREAQAVRFAGAPGVTCNALMSSRLVREHCALDEAGQRLLRLAVERLGLSARAHDRVLKVARTIADLAGSGGIRPEHVSEAIQYRSLDRSMA